MLDHRKFFLIALGLTLAIAPAVTQAQILSDGDFNAVDYTSSTAISSSDSGWPGPPAVSDIRYNVDYGNLDIFGDGFIVASLPEAPRSDPNDTATTGLFLSANNNSFATPTWSMAAVTPNGLNVGTGTATPNFKMTVDVFHSAGTGTLDPNGVNSGRSGTTNYSHLGIGQANTTVQVEDLNADPNNGNQAGGQGLGLLITADGGAAEDYMPVYSGAVYRDRTGGATFGTTYRGVPDPNGNAISYGKSGLANQVLNQYWLDQGLGFVIDDAGDPSFDPNTGLRLNRFTGNGTSFTPDPATVGSYDLDDPNVVVKRVYGDVLTEFTAQPTHLSGDFETINGPLGDNSIAGVGILGNTWSTHELYWIDGVFTYVMDGAVLLEIEPDYDPNNLANGNVYDDFSDSGSVVLGFFDRFNSVALSPDGANFVIYDNLTVEAATSGDAPDLLEFYESEGFLLSNADNADFDGDGVVSGLDFLIWQQNVGATGQTDNSLGDANGDGVVGSADLAIYEGQYGTSPLSANVAAVPEPMSVSLMLLACGCMGIRRRR